MLWAFMICVDWLIIIRTAPSYLLIEFSLWDALGEMSHSKVLKTAVHS